MTVRRADVVRELVRRRRPAEAERAEETLPVTVDPQRDRELLAMVGIDADRCRADCIPLVGDGPDRTQDPDPAR